MAQQVRGVVARAKGEPVTIETVTVPDPGPGEAVITVQACGVCHTDLHYREGAINDDFPFLLGHEAAGVVESVGDGVTGVGPGDYVVLAWRAPCGTCRSCRRGRPWYCFDSANATQPMTLEDGTVLAPALGIGAFADKTLVAAGQAVKVDPAARPEAAGLIGCGIMAGYGAAINTGAVRQGDTVAVFGCGGVGDAAIAGSKLAGATTIIAVDPLGSKREFASELGATHTAETAEEALAMAQANRAGGADVAIVTVDVVNEQVVAEAVQAIRKGGVVVLTGLAHPEAMTVHWSGTDMTLFRKQIRGSLFGDCNPTQDIKKMLALY
ncbi:MAG: alcohol dehydrogenase catalytic domain-containing protein, partial [Acidimicrobiales bacterium]